MRPGPLAIALVLALVPPARCETERQVVETEHYVLEAEAARGAVEEMGRVLEAAWRELSAFFDAAPDVEEIGKLKVRYLADRAAWESALRADGIAPPTDAGGYYAPGTKTAYLFRQPTTYFTRVLLLHEATHQFHYLARTNNTQPTSQWYREGVAEFLSWHHWDGVRVVLGVRPWVTLKDHPRAARVVLAEEGFDLEAVTGGRAWPGYPLAWALFRYLATGREGKPLRGFETFCRKADAGGSVGPIFRSAFGPARRFEKDFRAWLDAEQQPWAQVFNEWEDQGDGRLRGHAGVVSLCRTKEVADELSAVLEAPGSGAWRGGLLLQFTSGDDYLLATVGSAGQLRIERRKDGAWHRVETHRLEDVAPEGGWRLAARRTPKGVVLTVGEDEYGPWAVEPSPLGLAVDACDLVFRDVRWEAAVRR